MIRWLLVLVVVVGSCRALPPKDAEEEIVEVLSQEESDMLIEKGRQSDSQSELSWMQQSTFAEAMSVLFPTGRNPLVCRASTNEVNNLGVCMRVSDCLLYRGTRYGSCGAIGSCCIMERKCDDSSNMEVSHFINPTFTTVDKGVGECKLTVKPMHNNVCQYRLDFEAFELLGPDSTSKCVDDFFGVTGGSRVPKLCGDLTGQHVYVHMDAGRELGLTMDTSKVREMARRWNIKVTQIACNSPHKAPSGCLQFHNETSGTIRSFNYKPQGGVGGNRQIQNVDYTICINPKVGYCDVTYTQSDRHADTFTMTGNVTTDPDVSLRGIDQCNTDYIVITGGEVFEDRQAISEDRFCGTKLPLVKSPITFPTINVVTGENEDEDFGNTGFEIDFRQNLCTS